MNITDATYYQRGIKFIPNSEDLSARDSETEPEGSELDYFITNIERLLFLNCLGVDLYEGLQVALSDIDNSEQKYKDLLNGVTYEVDNVKYIFEGLKGFNKDSFIANFVFCKYLENENSYFSTTGVVKSKSANSDNFEPTQKYFDNWFSFLRKYQNKEDFNSPKYFISNGKIIGVDYYKGETSPIVTLEQFLKDHEEDYGVLNFKRYDETKNSFGI